ncbi:hypothetical protein ACMGGA_03765 [Citrobacter sp. BNK-39]|uniref:hypothetical protein n=1 Tax=unclassified Citrobacter TaxID=2644389 RepID=UPI003B4306C0
MQTINNRMTETQIADLFSLAVKLQVKAEESDDRDTAILAYSIQNACSNLTESKREFRAADATIHNLELKITDMAVQLANAESKCRELKQKSDIYDMLRKDYGLKGSLVEFVDWQAKRIAELEAREVELPKPISVLHRRDFNDAHRAIYAYPEAEVNAALAAAGIGVKGE